MVLPFAEMRNSEEAQVGIGEGYEGEKGEGELDWGLVICLGSCISPCIATHGMGEGGQISLGKERPLRSWWHEGV